METTEQPMSPPIEHTPKAEQANFEQRAYNLYKKFGLTEGVSRIDIVISSAREFVDKYKLPESFLADEINIALLLGCSQKLTESTDSLYKRRVESFLKRLVAPSAKELIDGEELWGVGPDSAGLDEKTTQEYVKAKTDPEATQAFLDKYRKEIEESKKVWREKDYELEVQVFIVDDEYGNFVRNVRAAGFINPPDISKLGTPEFKPIIEMVLLKGRSAEKVGIIRHELYHVKDFWNFFRRGYNSSVLEGVDELHTEYVVGSFSEEFSRHSSDDEMSGHYFSLKEFWSKASFVGDLDFSLLADRQRLINEVITRYGFEGFVDFAMMSAHQGGKLTVFEAFYLDLERPVLSMLISREKMYLRQALRAGQVQGLIETVPQDITELASLVTADRSGIFPFRNRTIEEMIPTKYGSVYTATPVRLVENSEAKRILVSYTRGLALLELKHKGEVFGYENVIPQIEEAVLSVPFNREEVDFVPETDVNYGLENSKERGIAKEEHFKERTRSLFHGLVYDTRGLDFAFCLNNPEVRGKIFEPFLRELDMLAQFCIDKNDSKYPAWFVDGIYGYNLPFELRELSTRHLSERFPQFAPIIDQKQREIDVRSIASLGVVT